MMNTYKVQAELCPPSGESLDDGDIGAGRNISEVFTANSDVEAIKAGVTWATREAKDRDIFQISVQRHPLPEADNHGQLHYDYPHEFFEWSGFCLLPLDVFTHAFLQAASGLASPAQ